MLLGVGAGMEGLQSEDGAQRIPGRVWGFRGLGFRVQGSGYRSQGLG